MKKLFKFLSPLVVFVLIFVSFTTTNAVVEKDTISYCHAPSGNLDKAKKYIDQPVTSWDGGHSSHLGDFIINTQADENLCDAIIALAQCADQVDNDGDGLVDSLDPGCHTDGIASNTASYNPTLNSEIDPLDYCPNVTGMQTEGLCADALCLAPNTWNIETQICVVPTPEPEPVYGCTDEDATNYDAEATTDDNSCTYPVDPEPEQNTTTHRSSGSYIVRGQVLGASTGPGQVLGAEATCGIYVDKFLKKGLKGNDKEAVKKVQQFLNDYMKLGLKVDGIFGPKTDTALKAFQTKHTDKVLNPWGLKKPTGIFYLTTQTEVNNIMCPELNLPIPVLIPPALNPLFPKA